LGHTALQIKRAFKLNWYKPAVPNDHEKHFLGHKFCQRTPNLIALVLSKKFSSKKIQFDQPKFDPKPFKFLEFLFFKSKIFLKRNVTKPNKRYFQQFHQMVNVHLHCFLNF